jgi:hypothetical protein
MECSILNESRLARRNRDHLTINAEWRESRSILSIPREISGAVTRDLRKRQRLSRPPYCPPFPERRERATGPAYCVVLPGAARFAVAASITNTQSFVSGGVKL